MKKKNYICETHNFEENSYEKDIIFIENKYRDIFKKNIFIIAFELVKYFSYIVAIVHICQKYFQTCELNYQVR